MSEEEQVLENGAEITEEEVAEFVQTADEIDTETADLDAEIQSGTFDMDPEEIRAEVAEIAATKVAETIAAAYRIVDLRGQFTTYDGNWGISGKSYGVVAHYNGPPTPERAWKQPVSWIKFISDLHAKPGRFARGWTFDGAAYHEFVVFGVVYRVRNYRADLPHCGNLDWNRNSLGLHIPVGGDQQPADSTLAAFFSRTTDHLRAMALNRSRCVGHQEVGQSACPGSPITQAIRSYRAGRSPGGSPAPEPPAPSPPPTGRKTRYQFCQDDSGAPGILTYQGRDTWRVTRISQGQHRGVRRMDRAAWCRDNSAPAPVVLTWQGRDGWYVERL